MRFVTADDAARAYLQRLERLGSPRGVSLTVSAGRSYAPRCPRCASPDRITGAGSVERCRRCGVPWPFLDVEVPRSQLGAIRDSGARERQQVDLSDLGVQLSRLKTWERRVLLLYATGAYSLGELLEECRRRWPHRSDGWTLYRVRADLADARRAFERRLRRAGMLAA